MTEVHTIPPHPSEAAFSRETDLPKDPLDPATITGLGLPADRLAYVAAAFAEIRAEIEKLRQLDLGETQPAVTFAPETPASGTKAP